MKPDFKPFLTWFGYSRRERRSTFILLIILVMIIAGRYLITPKEIQIEDLSRLLVSADTGHSSESLMSPDTSRLFSFDPNHASFDTLILLGLSEKQAETIINYRNKGGKFNNASDIRKIYGMDEKTAVRIIPYIDIRKDMIKINYYQPGSIKLGKTASKLDLNKCDSADLVKLPGLGPVLSSRIIKFRKLLGGFASADQLKEVYGLPEETFNNLVERVYADSLDLAGLKVNDPGLRELSKHPYLTRYETEAIIKYKKINGRILSISELVENKILSAEKAKKLSPYFKF